MWSIKPKKFRRGSTRPIKYTKGPFPIIGEIIWFLLSWRFFSWNFNILRFHEKKIDICWCENYSNLKRIYLLHKTLTIYSFCILLHTRHLLFPISIVLISLLFQNLIFNSKYIFKSLLKLRILNCQLKYVGVQRHNIEIEYILFGGQIMLKWFLPQKIEKLNKHKKVCNIFCNIVSLFFLNEINFYMIWSFIFFYKYLEIAFRSNKIAIVHFSFK